MTTMGDLVNEVRSMLTGSLAEELNVTSDAYVAGSGRLTLKYARRSVQPGAVLCAGLNTFYVMSSDTSGQNLEVLAQMDGGVDENLDSGTIVRIKPRHTTWAIFREINGEINAMGSPSNGLYAYGAYSSPVDWVSGTYPLPDTWTETPTRLLMVRYHQRGLDSWRRIAADWQADRNAVLIPGPQPDASEIEFYFAFPFKQAGSLADDIATLGISPHMADIPGLGAAANLSRTNEGRRQQVHSQGDPRRPQEVAAGANVGVAREYDRLQNDRIAEEQTRLIQLFGYWTPMPGVSAGVTSQ